MRDVGRGASSVEEWRYAIGFEPNYAVSNLGQVLNLHTGRLLSGEVDKDGYRRVNLSRDGKICKRRVHRLVCEAFHGPCPSGMECCHGDGKRLNNRADNLRWATRADNVQDSIRHGTFNSDIWPAVQASARRDRRGHRSPGAKFTAEEVAMMRQRRTEGWSERTIAREFGCSPGTAHKIVTGKRYVG